MEGQVKSPPYWYVDLKWIFGLLFSFTLFINLLVFVLSTLTSEEVAIPVATQLVAQQFSRQGLDEADNVAQVSQKFLATGQDRYYPFGEKIDAYLTREDVQTLSPKDLRLKLFRQLVEPVYYKKSDASMEMYGVLAFINIETHAMLLNIYKITFIPLILFLSGFVFFSFGLGKLVNPALSLIFYSGLPSLLFFLIKNTTPPEGDQGPFSFLPRDVLLEIIKPLSKIFNIYLFLGFGLLFVAIIIKIFKKVVKNDK